MEQEEQKRPEEAVGPIKARNTGFNLTVDRNFENLLAYDARQGSSQTGEVPDIESPMAKGDSTPAFSTQMVESPLMPPSPAPTSGVAGPMEEQNVGLDQMEGHALADRWIGGSIEPARELEVASPATTDPEGDPLKFMTQETGEEAIIECNLATPSLPHGITNVPPLELQAAISSASRPVEK